ncbi:MAG: hypothetical protein ACJ74M_03160 [Gaiellaceae bacterium]|jgi:uncharacterized membrane protein
MSGSLPMATPTSMTPRTEPLSGDVQDEIERTTWLDLGAMLLFLVGAFNVIDGIAAISDSKYVVNQVLFANLHAWGWFFLIWGVIQLFAAFAVFRGATWGVAAALVTVFVNAIAQLSAAKTYPVWSITIIVLDVLVMYGLVVHSGRRTRTPA